MMTAEEEELILEWDDGISGNPAMTLVYSEDKRSELFQSFCERLSSLSSKVKVAQEKGDEAKQPPSLEIDKGLVYHAIPQGLELAPFLEVLFCVGNGQQAVSQNVAAQLEKLKTPCFLKLFIASACPHCPKMVQELATLPLVNDLIKLTIIDGQLFPEMAEPLDIRSAPTLLLDERMRWTGWTPLREILDVLLTQDPTLISAASIESLLRDGKAGVVARMMLEQRTIFQSFYELLTSEKWSVRLGAMVAMEEIIEQDKGLARECVMPLWAKFPSLEAQIGGDVVYILGQAGNRDTIPYLEKILSGPYSDEIGEVAREAIATISEKP